MTDAGFFSSLLGLKACQWSDSGICSQVRADTKMPEPDHWPAFFLLSHGNPCSPLDHPKLCSRPPLAGGLVRPTRPRLDAAVDPDLCMADAERPLPELHRGRARACPLCGLRAAPAVELAPRPPAGRVGAASQCQ